MSVANTPVPAAEAAAAAPSDTLIAVKNFAAGSVAGFACKLVEFPFDTVKVMLQTQGKRFSGPIDCIKTTIAHKGVFSLYRGLTTPLLGSMAENAVLFSSYKTTVAKLDRNGMADGIFRSALGGLAAGIGVSFVLTPVELIKCKLQIQSVPGNPQIYRGPWHCITQTVRTEGVIGGLYRGHLATLMREAPGNMAWYTVYETLCRYFTPEGKTRDDIPGWKVAMAGGMSGMAYWTAFYPADTVKSQQQTNPAIRGQGFGTVFMHILRTEGARGLYKGWAITVGRAMPSNAVLFFVYELVAKVLR